MAILSSKGVALIQEEHDKEQQDLESDDDHRPAVSSKPNACNAVAHTVFDLPSDGGIISWAQVVMGHLILING